MLKFEMTENQFNEIKKRDIKSNKITFVIGLNIKKIIFSFKKIA